MTPRHYDWPEKLAAYLVASAERPFEWGVFDCAQFVGGAIECQTGTNPAAQFGAYGSRETAEAVISANGGSLENIVSNLFREIPVNFAQRGDVVVWDGTEGPTLGIVGFSGEACFIGLRQPVSACRRAWRVE